MAEAAFCPTDLRRRSAGERKKPPPGQVIFRNSHPPNALSAHSLGPNSGCGMRELAMRYEHNNSETLLVRPRSIRALPNTAILKPFWLLAPSAKSGRSGIPQSPRYPEGATRPWPEGNAAAICPAGWLRCRSRSRKGAAHSIGQRSPCGFRRMRNRLVSGYIGTIRLRIGSCQAEMREKPASLPSGGRAPIRESAVSLHNICNAGYPER